jgi:CBS domain-containing protein
MPEDFQDRMQDLTAADAMTRQIVAVGPDATVEAVARTMLDDRVHRVLVLEAGVLLGVISTFDLLPALLRVPAAELTRRTGHSR